MRWLGGLATGGVLRVACIGCRLHVLASSRRTSATHCRRPEEEPRMLQSLPRAALTASALVLATVAAPSPVDSTRTTSGEATAGAALDTALAKSLKWRSIGPDRGGRSIAATGV